MHFNTGLNPWHWSLHCWYWSTTTGQ